MEFAASFSGGKDSALAIRRMLSSGHRITAIIVSSLKDGDRSWTHGLKREYFEEVADILRCELISVNTDVENYEENFEKGLSYAKKIGAEACVFGDIDIAPHLKWNKDRCMRAGIECIHPLMFEDRETICREFIASKMDAEIVKVNEKLLPSDFKGMMFDEDFLEKLDSYPEVDKCGENGEFHTCVDSKSIRREFFNEVYMDNASTCYPKAPGVATEMSRFTDGRSYSINRGTFMKAYSLSSEIIDVRDKVLKFTDAPKGYHCIFVPSATEGINLVLRGITEQGDRIVVDDRIHNSTWRTVEYLKQKDIDTSIWDGDVYDEHIGFGIPENSPEKEEDKGSKKSIVEDFRDRIDENTKAVFVTLVDNITGKYLDEVHEIGEICEEKGLYFIVDAVQAVCERKFSVEKLGADAVIISSHIGAMGPEGVAAVVMSDKIAKEIKPLVYGGTGSQSNSPSMPLTVPDKFEAGTMNLPGIVAFGKALDFIDIKGVDEIISKKHSLGERLRSGLKEIDRVNAIGDGSFCSVIVDGEDDAMVAFNLDMVNHIMTRVGIQCSPCTHIAEGSFPNGSIRFSVGYFNNIDDIDYIIESVRESI